MCNFTQIKQASGTYNWFTLGIEHKEFIIAAICKIIIIVHSVVLVSDQYVTAIVPIANTVHLRSDVHCINFHTAKVCCCFLKKNINKCFLWIKYW